MARFSSVSRTGDGGPWWRPNWPGWSPPSYGGAARPARAEIRSRVVRTLAEALGMPEPGAVAEAVTVVAGAYFAGEDAAADEAVAWLVAQSAPGGG